MHNFMLKTSAAMREMGVTTSVSGVSRLKCIAGHLKQPKMSLCSAANPIPEKCFVKGSPLPPCTPGKLRLYSMRLCPWAQRTRLVLLYKNIPFETVNVNLRQKPVWLWERNPLGLVPILELDGKIIYESSATCMWLDDVYPHNRLTPTDPDRKAYDRILEEYFNRISDSFYSILRGADLEKVLVKLQKCYSYYENVLVERGGPYFGGDKPAMIDFLMWPHMERIPAVFNKILPEGLVHKEKYPKLDHWFEVMYQLPAVQATMFDHESHQKFVASLVNKTFDCYDLGL